MIDQDKKLKSDFDQFDTRHLQENMGRRAVLGGSVLFLGQGVGLLLTVTSTIILARLLLPEDFGLLAMVLPFVGFLAFFRDSGLHLATIQQETISHEQVSTLFWVNIGLGVFLMIVLALLSPVVAEFFGRPELVWITLVCAINMLIGAVSIQHAALLMRQMAYLKLMVVAIISQLFGISVGIYSAWRGLGYWALIAMMTTTSLAQTVMTLLVSGWIPGFPHRGTGVRKMLAFGGGITISNLFNQATLYVDGILIGRMLGATQLGYYDRAKQLLVVPMSQLMRPMSNLSISVLSRFNNSPERYARTYLRIQEKLIILSSLLAAFLIVSGDLLIQFLLGPQWKSAGPILQAFAIGGLIIPVSGSVSWLLITQARSRDLALWSPFSFVFRCLAILSGYRWGLFGIAVSISVFQYLSFLVFSYWVGRKGAVTMTMVWKNMIPALVAALVTCTVGFSIKTFFADYSLFASICSSAVVSSLVFLAVLWLIPSGKASLLDFQGLTKLAFNKAS